MFGNKHKGCSLQGIISIALGEKDKGLAMLEQYNKENHTLVEMRSPSENLRRRHAREHARDIYNEVSLHREEYYQNVMGIDSDHTDKIEHVQVTTCGTRFTTASRREVKVWTLKPEIECLFTIELEEREENQIVEQRVLASLSADGSKLIVYERITLQLTLYNIKLREPREDDRYEMAGEIDVV